MNDFAIVTAATPDYIKKLKWTIPTWTVKPQFAGKTLYVFHNGFKDESELYWIKQYFPDLKLVEWSMEGVEKREMMLSAFVLGAADYVEEEWFVKLDADSFFTDSQDCILESDFSHDLVAHKWGYTKPAWWMHKLNAWTAGEKWKENKKDVGAYGCKRIISWCCLHKTEFVRKAAEIGRAAEGANRLPVPSHDTYLWYMADRFDDASWAAVNMKERGVNHCHKWKSIREEVCSSDAAWNSFLNSELLKHVQLEITTACNRQCINCDRNCGTAPSSEHMTVEQVAKFVNESVNHKWNRIDIIGGEPTLHKDLPAILESLDHYRKSNPGRTFRFTSNGTGEHVKSILATLPEWVELRNSDKEEGISAFETVNDAPIDKGITNARACSIPWRCGLALTRYGYFLCGAGASIARVFGLDIGIKSLDNLTIANLQKQKKQLCKLCGHSRSTAKTSSEQVTSKSWEEAFKTYKNHSLELY